MMGLADFLTSVRNQPTHHLVIGNGAGDADSIISALTLAYVESMATPIVKTPIVSIPRAALDRQRPEVTLLLQLIGIPTSSLICADDYLMRQRDMSDYDVTLVDHNAIESGFQSSGWTVTEIVDHHVDQGYYVSTCSGVNRTVAFAEGKPTVVSTCVLVLERMKRLFARPYPATVGLLLLGVILLDSVNLSTEARQVSLRDEDAVRELLMNTDWKDLSPETKERLSMTKQTRPNPTVLFNALQSARYDPGFWDALSVPEALDYDFKEYSYAGGMFGVSTILMPLNRFITKPGLQEGILEFLNDIRSDFLAIMLAYDDGSADRQRRQLVLCGTEHFAMNDLVDYLVNDRYSEEPLRLEEIYNVNLDSTRGLEMRLFEQGNVLSSRKQIGPILLQFFEEAQQN
jgi:exopolyphosphatase